MPLRTSYVVDKPMHDLNAYNDFNIYDRQSKKTKHNIASNDVIGNYADLAISMTNITEQTKPNAMCVNGIEHICNIIMKKSPIINAIGLYTVFGALYMASNGATEIELKNWFMYPKKEYLHDGLHNIVKSYANINSINIKNIMLIGHDVPYNDKFYSKIKNLCIIGRVNIQEPKEEAHRLNMIMQKMMITYGEIGKPLVAGNIEDLQLMFLNLCVIRPIWTTPFDRVMKINNVKYMCSNNKKHYYYEDGKIKLIEIECENDSLRFGVINSRVAIEKLKFMIAQMKFVMMNEVKIISFTKNYKLRFTNLLKELGLSTTFVRTYAQNMLPEGAILQDVVQNISIIIECNNEPNDTNNIGYTTNRKFIMNESDMFYFRLVENNVIVFVGC